MWFFLFSTATDESCALFSHFPAVRVRTHHAACWRVGKGQPETYFRRIITIPMSEQNDRKSVNHRDRDFVANEFDPQLRET